jgi:hypothetical protein
MALTADRIVSSVRGSDLVAHLTPSTLGRHPHEPAERRSRNADPGGEPHPGRGGRARAPRRGTHLRQRLGRHRAPAGGPSCRARRSSPRRNTRSRRRWRRDRARYAPMRAHRRAGEACGWTRDEIGDALARRPDRALVPAAGPHRRRGAQRRRGAGPLGAPRARPPAAVRFPPGGRGGGPVGAARRHDAARLPRRAARFDEAGLHVPRMSVNFAPAELRNPGLVDRRSAGSSTASTCRPTGSRSRCSRP